MIKSAEERRPATEATWGRKFRIWDDPYPVIPPCAPVAAMRAWASDVVVQVIDVPGELTRGRAAQVRPDPQGVVTYLPLTHWAKAPPTHALVPSVENRYN
jgi:hypothetical protein